MILCFAMMLPGCVTVAQKQAKAISTGVYAVEKSIEAGRFDLAKKYEDQLIKVVPPPKKPVDVKPIEVTKNGVIQQTVILPQGFENKPVVTENSDQFTKILNSDPKVKAQVAEENKEVGSFTKQVEDTQRAEAKAASEQKSKSWFSWIWATLGIGGTLGLAALCFFFPAAIPFVVDIFKAIMAVVNGMLSAIGNLISSLTKKK